jgi:hypothetical protein
MADIVTLNRVRKAKAKEAAKRQAEANRIAFGRPKAERDVARHDADKLARDLDGKKIED